MTSACRRCHYALEDFINNDIFACFDDSTLSSRRCFSLIRDNYNFEQDFFGIIKPGAKVDLSLAGDGGESEDSYAYGLG